MTSTTERHSKECEILQVLAWPAYRNSDLNPYTRQIYEPIDQEGISKISEFTIKRAMFADYHVLHIHWPDALIKNVSKRLGWIRLIGLTSILLIVNLVRRKSVVWTVHNTEPHDPDIPAIQRRALHIVLASAVTHLIFLTESTRMTLEQKSKRYQKKPYAVIDHPLYEITIPDSREARTRLRIPHDVLTVGMVGTLEAYKGVDRFIDSVQSMGKDDDLEIHVVIAGACRDNRLRSRLQACQENRENIHLELGWIDDRRFADYLSATDLMVYPYSRMENSGSVIMAISAGTTVAVPNVASMHEILKKIPTAKLLWIDSEGQLDLYSLARSSTRLAERDAMQTVERTDQISFKTLDFLRSAAFAKGFEAGAEKRK